MRSTHRIGAIMAMLALLALPAASLAEDAELVDKQTDFRQFVETKVKDLERNHKYAKARMQVIKQPGGTYLARYHDIDDDSLAVKVRRSKSKTIPFVGVLSYQEQVLEASGRSPDECTHGDFAVVQVIPNRHIFSYKNGNWK